MSAPDAKEAKRITAEEQKKQAEEEAKIAEERKRAIDNSVVMKPGDTNKKPVLDNMVKNFSQQAFISKEGKGLQLYPQSDSDSEGHEGETPEEAKRRKEKKKA
jgi:hypothetical protein